MGDLYELRCACGWETTGTADEIYRAATEHGRRVHNMELTREEAMAMARLVTKPS